MRVTRGKDNKTIVMVVLLGIAAVLAVLAVIKVAGYLADSARAASLARQSAKLSKYDANEVASHLLKKKAVADELKQKNLFAPPAPKENPVKEVTAIFGDSAYINGDWRKAGAKIGDAKILAIEPTRVKVEWNGKIHYFAPIAASSAVAQAPEPAPVAPKAPDVKKTEAAEAEEVKAEAAAEGGTDDPFAFLGVALSPRIREQLLEQWNKMPEEAKEKAKAEWNNMSDEQKQQAISAMEQNL
jgi:hypothetical protein